jgi:hypothetical protein
MYLKEWRSKSGNSVSGNCKEDSKRKFRKNKRTKLISEIKYILLMITSGSFVFNLKTLLNSESKGSVGFSWNIEEVVLFALGLLSFSLFLLELWLLSDF